VKSFRHRGRGEVLPHRIESGIQPKHAGKLRLRLFALDNAKHPGDMNAPGMETSSPSWGVERSLGSQRQRKLASDVQVRRRGRSSRRWSGLSL